MSSQEGKGEPSSQKTEFSTASLESTATAGVAIGPYHLIQLIGTGGMGEVWLAEQKQPVRRRVAVKLIKAGMDTREVIGRFESERQALALMDHPAIAKVYDAGSTPEGRPYFVMEYVAGLPITEFCDKHKLSMRERLELFMRVCEGVQHAHQKAIIHRDLKPSNILVTEVDGKPAPRIIDFGVARATSQRLTAETMLTRLGNVIGTPGYISPEQADSGGEDIDTRTDVYSLGVVLYELLTGAQPLELRKLAFAEILRKLREEDPAPPSTKLRSKGEESATAARNRGSDPPTLARQVRGDLDAISLKALEKERSRRYGTPMELAWDIGRYLRHEPVLAHRAGAGYRARKYIRRHRIAVAAAAAIVLLAVSFGVAQTIQLRRTARERDRANRITEFMTNMFKVSDPSQAHGNLVPAREILDKASNAIDTGLAGDPELQAQLMFVMGTIYDNLGLYPRAQALLQKAAGICRRVLGRDDHMTLTVEMGLASLFLHEGRYRDADSLDRETIEIQRRVLGPQHPDTLASMSNLGAALFSEGKYPEAVKILREVLDTERRVTGADRQATLATMNNLALGLLDQNQYAEAEALQREAVERAQRVLGAEHPTTLMLMNTLGKTLRLEKKYAEAEKLDRDVVDTQRRVLGPAHPQTAGSISQLATLLLDEGRYSEAEKLEREAVDFRRRNLGPDNPDTAISIYNLGCLAARQGRKDEALSLAGEAVDHGLRSDALLAIGSDPDLESLYGDPRFTALVAHAKERAVAAQAAAASGPH
jgi:eukaryotic-like serine/threonine-protein kinase